MVSFGLTFLDSVAHKVKGPQKLVSGISESKPNLTRSPRHWCYSRGMGCWGLLGWLLQITSDDWDHSRKFPAFSSLAPVSFGSPSQTSKATADPRIGPVTLPQDPGEASLKGQVSVKNTKGEPVACVALDIEAHPAGASPVGTGGSWLCVIWDWAPNWRDGPENMGEAI